MKKLTLLILLIAAFSFSHAQSLQDWVEKGVEQHDKGNYKKAIKAYAEAIKIDPKSELAHYETALSYFELKNYDKAIAHCDKVLKQRGELMVPAYMIKGSALDNKGETKASIKLFNKAIKKEGDHYLLNYNLALNHFRINEYEKAEAALIKAIEENPGHPSSHLLMSYSQKNMGNKVPAVLSAHFFLMLEPTSARSPDAYTYLMEMTGGNVSKDDDKPNTINVLLGLGDDDEFSAAELMLSLLQATNMTEENEGKSDEELFKENMESFFGMLSELGENREEKTGSIYWDMYIPFFAEIAESDHMEAYCHYISQSGNAVSAKWVEEHTEEMEAFSEFMN